MLHKTCNRKSTSIIVGLALWPVYFQIHGGSIKSLQVIELLCNLKRQIHGKMVIIQDGAPIHRSVLVKKLFGLRQRPPRSRTPPAYDPELNPAEYMW